ncbi:tetratricopeptide repeat protein [Algibacillus agarilyticus]|uniref:tetratricopeptide repeat protein n=1 Tax=Algibacillus agarilyticus TaxID=2234133 RepID=UPI000DCF9F5C|nr:tetratricopeptide repeat protein [Algibacillus agarilyticus]
MSDVVSLPAVDIQSFEKSGEIDKLEFKVKALIKKGLFIDALTLGEQHWGPIKSWQTIEQQLIARPIWYNLGGDRYSDVITLKLWRKHKTHADVLERMLYYVFNEKGPIFASEFLQQYREFMVGDDVNSIDGEDKQADILLYEALANRCFKNFALAETKIQQAIDLKPNEAWFKTIWVRTLLDQDLVPEALTQALALLDSHTTIANVRLVVDVYKRQSDLSNALSTLQKYTTIFQSAALWLDLACLAGNLHDWSLCEAALAQFIALRIIKDKSDEQFVISLQAQLAIHKNETAQAINLLADTKSVYWKIVQKNLKNKPENAESKILDVPFMRQEHLTCAPTTMAALSQFWGVNFDSKAIAEEICFDGTPDTKERQWLRDNQFAFKEFELDIELAFDLIRHDLPFALVTTNGYSSHLQAVIGFNNQTGTLYLMDPSSSTQVDILAEELIKSEGFAGARCLVFVPEAQKHKLDMFDFPASDLYPYVDRFHLAQDKNDFVAVQRELNELIMLAPDHRLTLRCQRSYAISNNDVQMIADVNNKLLSRYPDEVVLLSSQFFCQRDTGSRAEAIKTLAQYVEKKPSLDLINTLFDEIYETNEQETLTLSLLDKLKMYGYRSASACWSIANYYWSNQSFTAATDYYLYAHCLDDTNSLFVESYYKAARYLGQQHVALDFLLQRHQKYKTRSANPAISLFEAYKLENLEHEGFEFLFEAIELHPNDSDLLRYLANKLIVNSEWSRFDALAETFERVLSQHDHDLLLANKESKSGHIEKAIAFYQTAFEQSPFVTKIGNEYFWLLQQNGQQDRIDAELVTLYNTDPQNAVVWDYLADWHSDEQRIIAVLEQTIKARPDYAAARRQLIDLYLKTNQTDKAHKLALETVDTLKGSRLNSAYLAKCLLKKNQFESAKTLAKEVLTQSIDEELAFDILFSASQTEDEKTQALLFIRTQMVEQVLFGNNAWNYWFEAQAFLDNDALLDFVQFLLQKHSHLWQTYAIAGMYYSQVGDMSAAVEILKQGIAKFPLTPRIHYDLGKTYEAQALFDDAINCYQNALKLNPQWDTVAKQLADLLENQGDLQSALTTVENTLKFVSNDGVLFGYQAGLLLSLNRKNEALTAFVKAVENHYGYRWAWSNLVNLADELGQPSLALDTAKKISKKSPFNAAVWCDYAFVADGAQKLLLLNKAIECDPHYTNAYRDKAQYYIELGDYSAALQSLDDTPWQLDLPLVLASVRAELLSDIGQTQNAVDVLKRLLYKTQGQTHLWRKLYAWLEQLSDQKGYIEACYKHIELNLHASDALCIASENLLNKGEKADQAKAKSYLEKAFQLAPNDEYIALTYIDYLTTQKEYKTALDLTLEHLKTNASGFVQARYIILLAHLQQADQALRAFEVLLESGEDDYWTINRTFEALVTVFEPAKVIAVLAQRQESLTEIQSYVWVENQLEEKNKQGYKKLLDVIHPIQSDIAWLGAMQAVLQFLNDHEITPDQKTLEKDTKRISGHPKLVQQLINLYSMCDQLYTAMHWFEQTEDKQALSAFCFYQYRMALQMQNRWDEAGPYITQGLSLTPDNVLHNLRLWSVYENWRVNNQVDVSELNVIDFSELIEIEQYVYRVLCAAHTLEGKSLETVQTALDPLLRECQHAYQPAAGHHLALVPQKLLRQRIKSAMVSTGFIAKLKLRFWISNRF